MGYNLYFASLKKQLLQTLGPKFKLRQTKSISIVAAGNTVLLEKITIDISITFINLKSNSALISNKGHNLLNSVFPQIISNNSCFYLFKKMNNFLTDFLSTKDYTIGVLFKYFI